MDTDATDLRSSRTDHCGVPFMIHSKAGANMAGQRTPEIPVRFYRTRGGNEPVLEWLRSLNREDRHTIGLDLMRVQFGWPIGMPLGLRPYNDVP